MGPRLTAQLLVFGRTPPGSTLTSLPPSLIRAGQATHARWVRRMVPPPGYMLGNDAHLPCWTGDAAGPSISLTGVTRPSTSAATSAPAPSLTVCWAEHLWEGVGRKWPQGPRGTTHKSVCVTCSVMSDFWQPHGL